MASGCIIGRCTFCNKPIYKDENRIILAGISEKWIMHEDCFYDFTGKIKKFMEMLECTIESEDEGK